MADTSQELVHWAGTVCVGRGELEITFDELLDAMHAARQTSGAVVAPAGDAGFWPRTLGMM